MDERCEAFGATDTVTDEPGQAAARLGRRHDRRGFHRIDGHAPHVLARTAVTIADLAFPIDQVLRGAPGCPSRRAGR